MNVLELGYKTIKDLNAKIFQVNNQILISYSGNNQAVCTWGDTEEEAVEEFYHYYQRLISN